MTARLPLSGAIERFERWDQIMLTNHAVLPEMVTTFARLNGLSPTVGQRECAHCGNHHHKQQCDGCGSRMVKQ